MDILYQVNWKMGFHLRKTYTEAREWAEYLDSLKLPHPPLITVREVPTTDEEFADLGIKYTELLVEYIADPSEANTQAWLDVRDKFSMELDRRIERRRKEAQHDRT